MTFEVDDRVIFTKKHTAYLQQVWQWHNTPSVTKMKQWIAREDYRGKVVAAYSDGAVRVIWQDGRIRNHFGENLERL